MLKLFIACVTLVFVAHHRIMNQMLGNIAILSKNATQFNDTVHTCLHHLEVTSEIATENFAFVKYFAREQHWVPWFIDSQYAS